MAMLWMWSGTATADDPPLQTYEECLAGLAPETCLEPGDDGATDGDATGTDEGAGTAGDEEGVETDTGSGEVVAPPEELDDPTVTQPTIVQRAGEDDGSGGATEGAAAAEASASASRVRSRS